MRRLAIAFLAVIVPVLVMAGATWSTDTAATAKGINGVKATSVTGTETAPTSATAGISLNGAKSVDVFVETISGNMSVASLIPYVYNPSTGVWAKSAQTALTLATAALPAQGYISLAVAPSATRIAWEPSSVGTTVTIYVQTR